MPANDIVIFKRILISGGTGFVGCAIVRALVEKYPKFSVAVVDRSPPRLQHVLPENTPYVQVNITSPEECPLLLNEPFTFRDFCLATWAHFGHIPFFEFTIPEGLAYPAGLVCEVATWVTGTTTTFSRGSVRDACAVRYANGETVRTISGYEARIGIEEAIRLSCEEYAHRIGVKLPHRRLPEDRRHVR